MTERDERPGYVGDKEGVRNRLRRIAGQVGGLERMVEEERYCIDVLTQISAVQAALDRVALALLDEHARHCVIGDQPRQVTVPEPAATDVVEPDALAQGMDPAKRIGGIGRGCIHDRLQTSALRSAIVSNFGAD